MSNKHIGSRVVYRTRLDIYNGTFSRKEISSKLTSRKKYQFLNPLPSLSHGVTKTAYLLSPRDATIPILTFTCNEKGQRDKIGLKTKYT